MKSLYKTDWERLEKMVDSEIDYSGIPETDKNFWSDSEIFVPHKKVVVKIKIDEDIANWIKDFGAKSNEAINTLLRSYFIGIQHLHSK